MRSRLLHGGTVLAVLALLGLAVVGLLTGGSAGGENRAYEIEQRLRCPVCKSVSIAESPSDSAGAMRAIVAEQVAAGRSDQQIIDYFRARYGDWVLLDPPASGTTLPLWLLPIAALAVGGIALAALRRRRVPSEPEPTDVEELDPAQRERLNHAVHGSRAALSEEEEP
ncbi:cytochrome C biosynthesis protein [Saccharomonospora sp. CUA-673]|nr:cytochrome C biosynthesis protein [Saccharomonospora sp. CUA-673]